jgi:hypothetical protein
MSNAPTEKKTNNRGKYTRWLFLALALGLLAIAEFVLEMDLGYPILGGVAGGILLLGLVWRKLPRILHWILLLPLIAAVGLAGYLYFLKLDRHDVYDYVPKDAIFIVEADNPIENWKALSKTKIWRHMKTNDLFSDMGADCDYLDTLIKDNSQIFKLVSGKKLLVVAEMISESDYDFLYLMDLKEGGKISALLDIFKGVLKSAGLQMNSREISGHKCYGIGEGSDEVFLAFEGNVMVASYSKLLMTNAFEQSKNPYYPTNDEFLSCRKRAYRTESSQSLAKVHLNFSQLDEYLVTFMGEVTGTVRSMSENMNYASFDLKMHDEFAEMSGDLTVDLQRASLPNVLSTLPGSEIRCINMLPSNTSFMMAIDFADFDQFYEQISVTMKDDDGYDDYEKYKKQIGGLLGVDKEERKVERKKKHGKDVDYFDWIGQEIAMSLVPVNETGTKQAYVAIFHSPDKENATHDLKTIEKRIKNRTPVKFEEYQYLGHEIAFLEMKGFFKLFFGKLFNKFDKPKYAILDEFVVFSNDTTAIHRIIDVAHGSRANLPMEPGFRQFFQQFETTSNYFTYVNGVEIYPFLPTMADGETTSDIQKNRKYITCFHHGGLQLLADEGVFDAKFHVAFKPEADKSWWNKLPE